MLDWLKNPYFGQNNCISSLNSMNYSPQKYKDSASKYEFFASTRWELLTPEIFN